MSRFFRIMVDEEALTNALFEFVQASRNDHPVAEESHTFVPKTISVLEHMILDGIRERRYMTDYIHLVFGPMSI